MFNPYSAGIDFKSSKIDPRTVRVNIFITVVDPWHGYSNESESAD